MNPRIGWLVGLFFAAIWLALGVTALPVPSSTIAAITGIVVLIFGVFRIWKRPVATRSGAGFNGRAFGWAMAFELGAMLVASWFLDHYGLFGYAWPVIGIIVGLHFIGLWQATHDRRFLWLTGAMVAVNLFALTLTPGSVDMQAISGFGSAIALAAAIII